MGRIGYNNRIIIINCPTNPWNFPILIFFYNKTHYTLYIYIKIGCKISSFLVYILTLFKAVPLPTPSILEVVSHPEIAWTSVKILQTYGPIAVCVCRMSQILGGFLSVDFGVEVKNKSLYEDAWWRSNTSKSVSSPITAVARDLLSRSYNGI